MSVCACMYVCMCVCVEPLAKWIFALLPKSFQAAGLMHCILQLLVKFCCDEVHEALGGGCRGGCQWEPQRPGQRSIKQIATQLQAELSRAEPHAKRVKQTNKFAPKMPKHRTALPFPPFLRLPLSLSAFRICDNAVSPAHTIGSLQLINEQLARTRQRPSPSLHGRPFRLGL